MDTDLKSNLLSMAPTLHDNLSNTFLQSELKEQFRSEKCVNNVGITELLGAAMTALNQPVTPLPKIKSGSCQIHTIISDGNDFDSDEILCFDEEHSNVEPVSLELELSLLDSDLDDSRSPKKAIDSDQTLSMTSDLSSSVSELSSSSASANVEPTNNSNRTDQILINFDDPSLSLEKKSDFEAELKVQPRWKLTSERNDPEDGRRSSCADLDEKIVNRGASLTKEIPNDHQNSTSNNVTKKNILNSNSDDNRSSVKLVTIDDNNVGEKSVPLEFLHKSQEKSNDTPYETLSKISNILKDCNDNIFGLYLDKEIFSLESADVNENDEVVSVKKDFSTPQRELKDDLKENASPDAYIDPTSLHSGETGLLFPADCLCRYVPNNYSWSSCNLHKHKTSANFVPSNDFRKGVNKLCKHEIPPSLVVKTAAYGDRIKVQNDNTSSSSSQENRTSHVKNCQTAEREILKESLKINIKAEPETCLKNEDSQRHDLADVFINKEVKSSATIETRLELSCDSSTVKSKSLTIKDYRKRVTNENTMQKDNRKSLFENSNLGIINSTCLDSKISAGYGAGYAQLKDKTTQNLHETATEHLKNNPEDKSSKFVNLFQHSTDTVVSTSSVGKSNQSSNENQQPLTLNKLKEKQSEGCVDDTSKGSSLGKLMLKNLSPMTISVKIDGTNQKRTVTLGKQNIKGENSFVSLKNKKDPVKSPSVDNDKMVKIGNKSDNVQIKTTSNLNKTYTELPLNGYVCKDSKNLPKDSDVITAKIPTIVSLARQYPTIAEETVTKSNTVPQKGAVTTPVGVKKRKKTKKSSAKKRAKNRCSLSKKLGVPPQAIITSIKSNNVSSLFKGGSETCSGNVQKAGSNSSSSTCTQTKRTDDTNVMSDNTTSKRKFVKARRGLYKQKQDAICVDKSDVNDRLQWVCQRWNVETLSNPDINLTTASYVRRTLPVQKTSCFQSCLEGQKDYTLAIVAPNRKRKLNDDDYTNDDYTNDDYTNVDYTNDDYTNDDYTNVDYNASKKRRLSNKVQLIPDNIRELPPDRKLIGNKAIALLATSQNMCLMALARQRNQEVNMFNEQYRYLQYQLQEKHFQERQCYNYYQRFNQEEGWFRLQGEHRYQKEQFDVAMSSRHYDLLKKFANKANELHTLYKTSIEKLKSDLSADETDSGYLTIALRMGPNRKSGYKMTHRNVCLTSQVALAMIVEDEIYDSFYYHNTEFD